MHAAVASEPADVLLAPSENRGDPAAVAGRPQGFEDRTVRPTHRDRNRLPAGVGFLIQFLIGPGGHPSDLLRSLYPMPNEAAPQTDKFYWEVVEIR
jgi:hypothetical protein